MVPEATPAHAQRTDARATQPETDMRAARLRRIRIPPFIFAEIRVDAAKFGDRRNGGRPLRVAFKSANPSAMIMRGDARAFRYRYKTSQLDRCAHKNALASL